MCESIRAEHISASPRFDMETCRVAREDAQTSIRAEVVSLSLKNDLTNFCARAVQAVIREAPKGRREEKMPTVNETITRRSFLAQNFEVARDK